MKAIVDQDTCIGCTICTQVCPSVFRMKGDKAVCIVDSVAANAADCCQRAAVDCPVNAIKIEP